MNGYVDLQVRQAPPGFRDADLRALLDARGRGTPALDRFLAGLPLTSAAGGRVRGRNLVFDKFAACIFAKSFGGAAMSYWGEGGAANAALATVHLLSTDSEPTYQESVGGYWRCIDVSGNVTSDCFKRFIEDDYESFHAAVDADGREAVRYRARFLYTTAQAVSSNIRSVGILFSPDGDNTGSYMNRAFVARIRLKDSGGTPIVVAKTASQILTLEYTLVLVTA